MRLGTTYICVNDMARSVSFYKKLLQQEPSYSNDDRWVTFDCGNQISLYNQKYDELLLKNGNTSHFNQAYLDDFEKDSGPAINNLVIFNFETDNIDEEYQRLKSLEIGPVSDIFTVNVHFPYRYFNITDPDGNTLEISEC